MSDPKVRKEQTAPGAVPASKFEGHVDPRTKQERIAAEQAVISAARIDGARFFAGRWETADGDPLTDAEAQQAHRAMDRAAAAARARVLEGR